MKPINEMEKLGRKIAHEFESIAADFPNPDRDVDDVQIQADWFGDRICDEMEKIGEANLADPEAFRKDLAKAISKYRGGKALERRLNRHGL